MFKSQDLLMEVSNHAQVLSVERHQVAIRTLVKSQVIDKVGRVWFQILIFPNSYSTEAPIWANQAKTEYDTLMVSLHLQTNNRMMHVFTQLQRYKEPMLKMLPYDPI